MKAGNEKNGGLCVHKNDGKGYEQGRTAESGQGCDYCSYIRKK
jgi:hypothetical protein